MDASNLNAAGLTNDPAIVTTVLAPASALSGIALPDAASFSALRFTPDNPGAGAPAAPWIHLIALTLALVVVVPRLVLALACGVASWAPHRLVAQSLPGVPFFASRLFRVFFRIASARVRRSPAH